MKKHSLIMAALVVALTACSGGSGTKTTDTGTNNPAAQTGNGSVTTPTTPGNTNTTDTGTKQVLAQGSAKNPHKVTSAKDLQSHHFYNIAGFKVCSSGYSPKDVYKKNMFINIVGPNETCGSDPKTMFTLILKKYAYTLKNVAPPAPGKIIEKGVVFPFNDVGNDRLVAFISEDVQFDKFKF